MRKKDHEAIPGSNYFRAYCAGCGDAIRVPFEQLKLKKQWCRDCDENVYRHIGCGNGNTVPEDNWIDNTIKFIETRED